MPSRSAPLRTSHRAAATQSSSGSGHAASGASLGRKQKSPRAGAPRVPAATPHQPATAFASQGPPHPISQPRPLPSRGAGAHQLRHRHYGAFCRLGSDPIVDRDDSELQLVRLVRVSGQGQGQGQWSGFGSGLKLPLFRHALQPTVVLPVRRAEDEAASMEMQVARAGGAWVGWSIALL